jgi:hypothetical protein
LNYINDKNKYFGMHSNLSYVADSYSMSERDLDEAQKNQRKIGAAGDDPHASGPTEWDQIK